jgi:hypothetical protein
MQILYDQAPGERSYQVTCLVMVTDRLSVILGYIKDDVTAAYNELTEPKEQTE